LQQQGAARSRHLSRQARVEPVGVVLLVAVVGVVDQQADALGAGHVRGHGKGRVAAAEDWAAIPLLPNAKRNAKNAKGVRNRLAQSASIRFLTLFLARNARQLDEKKVRASRAGQALDRPFLSASFLGCLAARRGTRRHGMIWS
jgi:hypothetical protein